MITRSILFCFVCILFFGCSQNQESMVYPAPTNGTLVKMDMENGEHRDAKKEYFKLLHTAPDGVDWKQVELENTRKKYQEKQIKLKQAQTRNQDEILADGQLKGKWIERGSIDQAGSVFVTELDAETNQVYTISAGGSLFRGVLASQNWEVLNQDLRFNTNFLKLIRYTEDDKRLVLFQGAQPHYSDDYGKTWTLSEGYNTGGGAQVRHAEMLDVSNEIFFVGRSCSNCNQGIYYSNDDAENFVNKLTITTSDMNNVAMCKPHGTNDIYVIEQVSSTASKIYKWNSTSSEFDVIQFPAPFSAKNGRGNLIGTMVGDSLLRLFAYDSNNQLFKSEDEGTSWSLVGDLPEGPWGVGVFVSKSNPDLLLMGAVECFRSVDGGLSWEKINNWWDYYDNVPEKLHADMMYFNEFTDLFGEQVILISNHGGLSESYDETFTNNNIGLLGLNVSQYYDVRTHPDNPNFVYAGAQDQGFQRGPLVGESVGSFDQVISGDYGHITFSDNGQRLWTVYPGGWVTYYHFPLTNGYDASWEVDSDNESVWIPPLMESPDPSENAIYMAGGNMDGGSGSHIIKLTAEQIGPNHNIIPTQLPFDFKEASGSEIAAMEVSPLNSNKWFVITNNGKIYLSDDGGNSFVQSKFGPSSHYLYGSCIYASEFDENEAWISGSGYGGLGVIKTVDGGENWTKLVEGLPKTTVFAIQPNEDESLFFAATEAGPYVLVVDEEQWYDMSGLCAPNQTYWSVEFVKEINTVRFGTYGRGVWDFAIDNTPSSTEELTTLELKAWPNPTIDYLTVDLDSKEMATLRIYDATGKQLLQNKVQATGSIDLHSLPAGSYFLHVETSESFAVKKILKL